EILEKIQKHFDITNLSPNVDVIETFLSTNKTSHAFVLYDGTKAYGLLLKDEKTVLSNPNDTNSDEVRLLDVVILRDFLFKNLLNTGNLEMNDVFYERSVRSAMEKIDNRQAKLAFLINPIDPAMVWQIARKRERLPEKSTDFYPKPVSGLVMMDIETEDKL
ncbi:MAG: DUF1015 domain-containing protein, partial [Crenarchaeota archaeon]|nr:DUF1015 domain-containing protein [Thermoproteota archaeon]